eukprot:bmy_14844T0
MEDFGEMDPKTKSICGSNSKHLNRTYNKRSTLREDRPKEEGEGDEKEEERPGYLVHSNAGANINGSKFFICTAKTEWLNGKHVVPGKVKEGMSIVEAVERYGTRNGKTRENITVAHCGQL